MKRNVAEVALVCRLAAWQVAWIDSAIVRLKAAVKTGDKYEDFISCDIPYELTPIRREGVRVVFNLGWRSKTAQRKGYAPRKRVEYITTPELKAAWAAFHRAEERICADHSFRRQVRVIMAEHILENYAHAY
jgi:hypothetical protein